MGCEFDVHDSASREPEWSKREECAAGGGLITDSPLSNRHVDSSVVDSFRCTAASDEHADEHL